LELRPLWLTLVGPFILLTLLAGLGLLRRFHGLDTFERIYRDFGMIVPPLTSFAIASCGPTLWCIGGLLCFPAVILIVLWLRPGSGWVWRVVRRVPLVGPLLRWSHLAQFSRLMGLLLEQQVPLPDALRLAAGGLRDANLSRACRGAADDVERGRSLDESLSSHRQFPASLIPVVQWGQQANALAEAFRAAAELFEGRARLHHAPLYALLTIWFLVIVTVNIVVLMFAIAMLVPLSHITTTLSS
jgi:type II secretory pathway component PulF